MERSTQPRDLIEYELAAREVLPADVFDYISGGAGDHVTLRACREAFARWTLMPRALRDVDRPLLQTTVLGRPVSLPVLLAPVGYQRLSHPAGEKASAAAARDAGTVFIASTGSMFAMEEVAPQAGDWWFQLYVFQDRGITRDLVRRAEEAGARALVITVDAVAAGRREGEIRHRFGETGSMTWANLEYPGYDLLSRVPPGATLLHFVGRNMERSLAWTHIDWLASLTSLPIILKGILHSEDARLAIEHGARGVVVSNHGGRQLDSAVASLDALPPIVEAVGGEIEVLLDGGVRWGADVLKALALGATSVLLGRPYVYGLAVDGQEGTRHVLHLLTSELESSMVFCGCSSIAAVTRDILVRGPSQYTM